MNIHAGELASGWPTRRLVAPLAILLAVVLSGLPGAPPPVRAAGSVTALAIDSEPGDFVGGGDQFEYEAPSSTFEIYSYSPGYLMLQVLGPGATYFWSIHLSAAGTGTLSVGTYENAQRSTDETHPGLDVAGLGHGCNASTGRFAITEIERDVAGNVTTLAASFEQHCEGAPAALFGEVRYQASAGYKLLAASPPASVALGSAALGSTTPAQSVHLTSSGTVGVTISALSISGADAADFAIVSEDCPVGELAPGASCDVTVSATPSAAGARSGSLVITDDTVRSQRTIGLTASGAAPVSAVAWGTTRSGTSYSWNAGQSLARTVNGATTYLHATYTTDRVSGAWADDNGPYVGVYYVRTTNGGSTFTTPVRLNSSAQRGSRGSVAASGHYVFATWVSTSSWLAYKGTAPRAIYIRRNTNHGASGSWGSAVRLTSTSGRVDYPTIAAAGSNVYVAYTDSVTGAVRLLISRNLASTWSGVTLGTSAWSTSSGRYGLPRIAASGNTIVVSWLSNSSGAVRARVSTDAGKTWGTTATLAAASTSLSSVAALGSRVAVAWTDGTSAVVRTWAAGTWSAPKPVSLPTGVTYTQSYGPAVALSGTKGIGVAWSGCVTACSTFGSSTKVDLVWSESDTAGATWFPGQIIGPSGSSSQRRYNDSPTVLWPSATVRYVSWNAGTAATNYYRIVLRTGSGVLSAASASAVARPKPIATDSERPIMFLVDRRERGQR